MTAAPHFSVVIAAYNAERWIVPAVRSALAQTYPEFEIIVIGDGCTDATGKVLMSTFGDAVRWKNLDRNHGSQSFPNNEGIRLARGTHVAYLGHDDVWSPRHLDALASVFRAHDADFAVSGAVFHGPPGSRYYQITGLFDDPETARTHFFPPSSFAHRKDIVPRVGGWRDPRELRPPVDCEFLLRAASAQCRFVSTRTITVHKFAAGHRYLSYRRPSAEEQERMLARLSSPDGEAQVLGEIERDIAAGADHSPIRYPDFSRYPIGHLFRTNRRVKGLEKPKPILVDAPRSFPVEGFAAGLDWHAMETHPQRGTFRWSGPNPNAAHLVNARMKGQFVLRIHVLDFAGAELADALAIDVDERAAAFARARSDDGTYVFTSDPMPGPVEDGIVLRFRLPPLPRLGGEPTGRRAGLALSRVEVVPVR